MSSYADLVNVGHILVVAPLIGYAGYKSYQGEVLPEWFALVLIMVSILAFVFHAWRLWSRSQSKKDNNVPKNEQ